MRFTSKLCSQHIGQMFKKHWYQQRDRVPMELKVTETLQKQGIEVVNALDYVKPPYPREPPIEVAGPLPRPITARDETHPLWNNRICHIFQDTNVLVTGMTQAQVLTKALKFDGLPTKLQKLVDDTEIPSESDKFMKNAILAAHLFDAQQEKLAIVKDPLRPAFTFSRKYGITDQRKNRLIIPKILFECERLAGLSLSNERKIVNDALFVVPFEKDEHLYQFKLHAETFIASKKPIETDNELPDFESTELPDIYPLTCNISIAEENIYKIQNIYPILRKSPYIHPHTIFLHYSTLDVKNEHATPVTQTQFESHSLLKAFAVAAARAQAEYGADVKNLPKPIIVQSVQVSGNVFYFGAFQLNTLDLNGTDGIKNYWFNVPAMNLYTKCDYHIARPRLTEYNPDVLKYALAFYKNN